MMEIPVIRTVGEWLAADAAIKGFNKHHAEREAAGREISPEDHATHFDMTLLSMALSDAPGLIELRALAEGELKRQTFVTADIMAKYRGRVHLATGKSVAEINGMTLVEFAEAIRRLNAPAPEGEAEQYVTLLQMAEIVNKSKSLLEKMLKDGELPQPDIPGGSGKPHEWKWAKVKPILETRFSRTLKDSYQFVR